MSIAQKLINGISDKILVQKARSGDPDAYGKLYMKYIDSIYRYIFFKVNCDRFESEDLTETVFLKAWDKLQNGEFKNDNFRAWIYRIAHNIVIDTYRTHKKTVALNDSIPSTDSPEGEFFQKKGELELLKAVNSLPDEQKQVITLKFIEGMKNEEIARILKKTNQAIRALQYRGLQQLKNKINHG